MRTQFEGFGPLTDGFFAALDGGPCDTPSHYVMLQHADDFETRFGVMRRCRERGVDLIALRLAKQTDKGAIAVAGVHVTLHCTFALADRFLERQCLPWRRPDTRIFLVPSDESLDECFMMGDDGHFLGMDGRPDPSEMPDGVALALRYINDCVQASFKENIPAKRPI